MTRRRLHLVAFAVLVAVFVVLYPYWEAVGVCDHGQCPYAVHSSHTASADLMVTCLMAAVVVSAMVGFALSALRGRRIVDACRRHEDIFLSPDRPPPQLSS